MSATWRDRRDLFLLPRTASALSAAAAARALRQVAAHTNAYSEEARNALAGARAAQWVIDDPQTFSTRFRLQLALGYRDNWRLMRNPQCAAPFSAQALDALNATRAPLLIISLHWASAIFALREIARRFGPTHFVSAPFTREEFSTFPLRFAFANRMAGMIEKACNAPQIYTGGGGAEAIASALQAGRNVCALIDVPPHQVGATSTHVIQGRTFQLPNGLARIAYETGANVVTLLSAPDAAGGDHFVSINSLGQMLHPNALMPHCAALLEEALTREPAAWTMWAHLPDFLSQS